LQTLLKPIPSKEKAYESMPTSTTKTSDFEALSTELKAEQALGLIGVGLMQKMSKEGMSALDWSDEINRDKADLISLRQRLEIISMAIDTGAPLTTSEVAQLLGAKPGSSKIERGGLLAKRISRNVWKLSKADEESSNSYWRN
tara:strand:- start:708 stop:1136 length:429 start_codon:yes stop_codon:yes gene_type:complete